MDPIRLASWPRPPPIQSFRNASAPLVLFSPDTSIGGGLWLNDLLRIYSLTLFMLQIMSVADTTRGSRYLLGPLNLLRYLSEIWILANASFTVIVIMLVVETVALSKIMSVSVRMIRRFVFYKRRTLRWNDPESELSIIACVHHPRDPRAIISLIDLMNPTSRSPILVSVVQMIKHAARASTHLFVNNISSCNNKCTSQVETQSEAIAIMFECYVQETCGVTINSTTAFSSSFDARHEDVIVAAQDRHAALILLPFHKHQAINGAMEITTHPSVRNVNESVMRTSPCTVGVVVDRGLDGNGNKMSTLRVVVLFFGGPDDRESIALAGRMVNHPSIRLRVVRFFPRTTNTGNALQDEIELRERQVDEECLQELYQKSSHVCVVGFSKRLVSTVDDILDVLEMILDERNELLIVGKGQGLTGLRLMGGMTKWSEFPELGPIGELLLTSYSAVGTSLIVMKAPHIASEAIHN